VRILVIRGRNLASLAGDFAIDLRADPLGRVGLFAITGPTGSGKSTLLDAICLALFDRMPRLAGATGEEVGRLGDADRVKASDVRGILRRGTGAGFAEVEFEGRDGVVYRARWSVRRAREKATGRLQTAAHELFEGDEPIATGKTATRAAIEDRLGLSYDQFRRAALLAQGDFAAFLKARDDERANLLERMTGTWIYGELSRAAYVRAKAEQGTLEDLKKKQDAFEVLEAPDRQALEAEITDEEKKQAEARQQLKALETADTWYGQRAKLANACAEAEQEHQRAELAVEESKPARAELADVRAADRNLRPLHDRSQKAAQDHGDAARAHEQAAARAEEAEAAHATAATAAKEAEAAQARTNEQQKQAQPVLRMARDLDRDLSHARTAVGEATSIHEQSNGQARAKDQELKDLQARITAAEEDRSSASTWQAEHADVEPIAARWAAVQTDLRHVANTSTELAEAEAAQPAFDRLVTETTADLEAAARDLKDAISAAHDAGQALEAAERAAAEAPAAEARRRCQQLAERKAALEALAAVAAEAATLDQDLAQGRADLGSASTAHRDAGARLRTLDEQRPAAAAEVRQAETALQRFQAALGLEDRRAQLVDGEACPLCGSESHPWVHETPQLDEALAGQQRAVEQLRRALSDLDGERAAAQERQAAETTRMREIEQRSKQLHERMEQAAQRWRDQLDPAGSDSLPLEVADPQAVPAVTAATETLATDLEVALVAEQRAEQLEATAGQAREERDRTRAARDQADEAHRRAERAALTAHQDQQRRREHAETLRRQLQQRFDDLAAAFVQRQGWREDLAADPSAFEAVCRQWVERWAQTSRTLQDVEGQLATDRKLAERIATEAAEAAKEAGSAASTLELRQQALAQLEATRKTLFEGRSADEEEAALALAVQQAAEAVTDAKDALQGADAARSEVRADFKSAADHLTRCARSHKEATDALAQALASLGMADERLAELLAHDGDWMAAQEQAFAAQDRRLHQAAGRVTESTKARDAHASTETPTLAEQELTEAIATATEALQVVEEALDGLKGRLAVDDGNRAQVAAVAPEIDEQKAVAELWWSLSNLIGSASGMKFKKFAQSLTLDVLLVHANTQLRNLRPRYQLQRVPGVDLALQVIDRDMGDEIRSVRSLSGGESFLVSLALALGLASLASQQTTVDSLFIDEGFGTLDGDTLEVALDALDTLQASGKQIGLISHVPGLAERIGVQVAVEPQGGGRSTVCVMDS